MKVQELMSCDVRACRPQDTVNEAARTMWEIDCGCVPVVDEGAHVVGMLTDRDVCMAAYTQGRPLEAITIDRVMAHDVVSCRPDDEIAVAERSMREARVRRLPVVDGDGRLAGILSLNDIARRATADRSHKTRSVSPDDVAMTLAAICEPRAASTTPSPAVGAARMARSVPSAARARTNLSAS